MHGRPRPPVGLPEDPEKLRASKQRLALFSKLCNVVLARRAAKQYDAESLGLAADLLLHNPEAYTVWNFRREALQGTLQGEDGAEAAAAAVKEELALTERCLQKNPKSYAAWHQRRWLVGLGVVPSLDRELALVTKLLALDQRNFQGWGYRRFVAARARVAPEAEDGYAQDCISTNFSNYSAWHARTVLLPQMHAAQPTTTLSSLLAAEGVERSASGAAAGPSSSPAPAGNGPSTSHVPAWALEQEFDLVEQATFTDPEDQSAWLYHRWLLSQALALHGAASGPSSQTDPPEELVRMLRREVERCRSLLDTEPDRSKCKWPILTLARLHELLHSLGAGDTPAGGEVLEGLYTELMQIDPMRKGYYQDALAGKAAVVTRPP